MTETATSQPGDAAAAASDTDGVVVRSVVKRFGDFTAVKGVDIDIAEGEFFTLLGPSGCGKTTTLRMIAGFEEPDEGQILIDGAGRRPPPRPQASDQHRLPELRAVPPPLGQGQRRLRTQAQGRQQVRGQRARPGRARARRTLGRGEPQAQPALRRSAAARRAGPGDRQPSQGPAARRAARRPRPEAAQGTADRAQADSAGRRHHLRLRHARPGRGADDVRPDRGHEPGHHRADRGARKRSTSAPPPLSSPASSASPT